MLIFTTYQLLACESTRARPQHTQVRVALLSFLENVCVCAVLLYIAQNQNKKEKTLQNKRILSNVTTLHSAILKSSDHYQANYPIIRQH